MSAISKAEFIKIMEEAHRSLDRGDKVYAIKHVRHQTGLGLRESRELVEANWPWEKGQTPVGTTFCAIADRTPTEYLGEILKKIKEIEDLKAQFCEDYGSMAEKFIGD